MINRNISTLDKLDYN